jgi:agmatinase
MKIDWAEFSQRLGQYLCPPGNGVHTVHTFKEQKNRLHSMLYPHPQNLNDAHHVQRCWKNSLQLLPDNPWPVLLGICSDNGGGILRGANWGPLAIREFFYSNSSADPKDLKIFDLGDVRVIPQLLLDEYLAPSLISSCRRSLYGDELASLPVSPLSIAYEVATHFHALFPHKSLLGLGGDHSVSYPLVLAYLQAKKNQGKKVALIHFDAHTDLLAERLGIGICFGSWTYHILPELLTPAHLVQIGIRSSGKDQKHWESQLGVKQYWAKEVKERGASAVTEKILNHLREREVEEIYVTFDIDALDSQYAFATGTPEPEGLSPHEVILILQELCQEFPLTGADLVEVAPFTSAGPHPRLSPEPETTLTSAHYILSFFIDTLGATFQGPL